MRKEMTLKNKLRFIDWAIDEYLEAGKEYFSCLCIILKEMWDKRTKWNDGFTFAEYTALRFPELNREIKKVLKRTDSSIMIEWNTESYCSLGRAKLLQRVRKQLLK